MAAPWNVNHDGQAARITTALGKDGAFLEDFTVTEALSEPFRIVCEVICPKPYTFMEHRGTGVSLEVYEGAAMVQRAFHGLLTEATLVETAENGYRFRLTARPWFWVLSLGRDSHIFQHKSVQDIIKLVFEKAGVATSNFDMSGVTDRGTIVREYCVQYQESDFAFVSRLMEEEGIYYFFEHTANSHVMKICDNKAAHPDFTIGDVIVRDDLEGELTEPHLTTLSRHVRPTIKEYAVRDQHWKVFGDMLDAAAESANPVGQINPKVFEYPGGFAYLTDDGATKGGEGGANVVSLGLHADLADGFVHTGYGDTFAVPVGAAVNLVWEGKTAKMLVCGATHRFSGQRYLAATTPDPLVIAVELEMVVLEQGWRPKRVTPKPNARGVQVAVVVGRKDEEVDIDEAGRVRVQFPWDRYGANDETSGCWVRVSQGWAGPDLGSIFFPRKGQEVLVEYIDGDMDRPIITGRVFDSKNVIPPKLKKTQSGIKTQTIYGKSTSDYDGAVDPPTDEPGFNEIAFDDKSGSELLYVRAQRDMWIESFRDEKFDTHRDQTDTVGRNLSMEVKTGDETHKVTKGKRTTTIKKDDVLTVQDGDRNVTVSTGKHALSVSTGDQSTTVSKGDQSTTISKGGQTTTVSLGDIKIDATAGNISVSAAQSIELKVGPSSIKLDPSGVTIKGPMITSDATGLGFVKAGGILTIQGSLTKIN